MGFFSRLMRRSPAQVDRRQVDFRDIDFDSLMPPNTVTDPAAWDRFWQSQVSSGLAGLVHMFVDDGELVDAMRANGLRRVVCAGNGISQEPRALAWSGFDVTAVDLSPLATRLASEAVPGDDILAGLVGGRSSGPNGRLEFRVGDLSDPTCCPGPYDVIIERKTLQLWPDADRPAMMKAVAHRLATPGIFFSHSHDGFWKPPARPKNEAQRWFAAEGWRMWRGQGPLTGQVAWIVTSTG